MTFPLKDALNKRWKTWYSSRRQGLVRRGSCWTRYCKYRCELERERPTRCDRIQRTRHKEEAHCVTCPLPMTQIGHCGVWPQQGWRALSGQRKKNVAKGWHSFWSPRVPFILFFSFTGFLKMPSSPRKQHVSSCYCEKIPERSSRAHSPDFGGSTGNLKSEKMNILHWQRLSVWIRSVWPETAISCERLKGWRQKDAWLF